jgi:hypothetical protein
MLNLPADRRSEAPIALLANFATFCSVSTVQRVFAIAQNDNLFSYFGHLNNPAAYNRHR